MLKYHLTKQKQTKNLCVISKLKQTNKQTQVARK